MAIVGLGMLAFFRSKGWIGAEREDEEESEEL
jgi:hypothetical protein